MNGPTPALFTAVAPPRPPDLGSARVITLADFDKPLPPIPWACQALSIAPGAPSLISGYGFSAKSVSMQQLALAMVLGVKVWGAWDATPGRVLHLDYEQGSRLTLERYQRLARGCGGRWDDRDPEDLRVEVYPGLYLDSGQDSYDVLARLLEKRSWCLIDSFRASMPTADENDSKIRQHIDRVSRASEATGCAVTFIHHANKPQEGRRGPQYSHRGSGAIRDAMSEAFVFSAEKGKPIQVEHDKDRIVGTTRQTFGLRIEDVPSEDGTDPRHGLRVVYLEPEEIAGKVSPMARIEKDVLECVKANPACSKRLIRGSVKGKNELIDEGIDRLLEERKLSYAPPAAPGLQGSYRAV